MTTAIEHIRALSSGWVSLPAGTFEYVPWPAAQLASTRRLLAIMAVLMCASTPMPDEMPGAPPTANRGGPKIGQFVPK